MYNETVECDVTVLDVQHEEGGGLLSRLKRKKERKAAAPVVVVNEDLEKLPYMCDFLAVAHVPVLRGTP